MCPQTLLSTKSIMVAYEMIKHGYKHGKGLGVSLAASEKFFSMGFQATEADMTWDDEQKRTCWF